MEKEKQTSLSLPQFICISKVQLQPTCAENKAAAENYTDSTDKAEATLNTSPARSAEGGGFCPKCRVLCFQVAKLFFV